MTSELERRIARLENRTDREMLNAPHELATEFARKQGNDVPIPEPRDLADALKTLAEHLPN